MVASLTIGMCLAVSVVSLLPTSIAFPFKKFHSVLPSTRRTPPANNLHHHTSILQDPRPEIPKVLSFGKTKAGEDVEIYTIANKSGFSAEVMTRGATLVNLHVPDKDGKLVDVVLGFDDIAGYESDSNQYFGATIGRVCNRIKEGKFNLDGKKYTLAINNESNHLHGGVERSFEKVVWKAEPFSNGDEEGQGVKFSYTSLDGEEGYPGKLEIVVKFFIPAKSNSIEISYHATTDARTPVNLTNHAYFNLSGEGSETVLNHILELNAEGYTPSDETQIPTGEITSVEGTDFDFRQPSRIGARIDSIAKTPALGFDHNYVLNRRAGEMGMTFVAQVTDQDSGRQMRVMTTEPGVQFYTGNYLFGQKGKGGKTYSCRSALCLETQHFPDAVNQPNFPTIFLNPDEVYETKTTYSFDHE
jgi:aldose 1-epimerase